MVLLAVGLVIRLKVAETPMFQKLDAEATKKVVPIVEVLKNHWRTVVIAFVAVLSFTTTQGLMTVWGVAEAVENGANRTGVLNWKAAAAITTVIVAILAAKASDRFGRRIVILTGCVLGVVLSFPIINLLGLGTVWGFTGASASYQTASTIGAGFSPLIATSLVMSFSTTVPVAVFWIGVLCLSALAVLITPEGRDREIHTPVAP